MSTLPDDDAKKLYDIAVLRAAERVLLAKLVKDCLKRAASAALRLAWDDYGQNAGPEWARIEETCRSLRAELPDEEKRLLRALGIDSSKYEYLDVRAFESLLAREQGKSDDWDGYEDPLPFEHPADVVARLRDRVYAGGREDVSMPEAAVIVYCPEVLNGTVPVPSDVVQEKQRRLEALLSSVRVEIEPLLAFGTSWTVRGSEEEIARIRAATGPLAASEFSVADNATFTPR